MSVFRKIALEEISMLKALAVSVTLLTLSAAGARAATLVWTPDVPILRIVNTTSGDFILTDALSVFPNTADASNCVFSMPVTGKLQAFVYLPGSPDNPKSHMLAGALVAASLGKGIKLAAVVKYASPPYSIPGLGTTSCYLDYADYEN
jgi:hypothetical protein